LVTNIKKIELLEKPRVKLLDMEFGSPSYIAVNLVGVKDD